MDESTYIPLLRTNSWRNSRLWSNEFAFLPFTVISTDVYFFKLTQPLAYFFKLTQPLTYFYSSVIVYYKRKPRKT